MYATDGWCSVLSASLFWTVLRWGVAPLVIAVLLVKLIVLYRSRRARQEWGYNGGHLLVGFFHPYCNSGGGGERVLWQAIHALQERYAHVRCVVYTGDTDATAKEILNKAQSRFGITLTREEEVHFVYLRRRRWVEAERWPRFTLLGQSLGSMVLGLEALVKVCPDIYFDTMGYAFTLPLFRWVGGCRTASYVHYPVVSCDMIESVSRRKVAHNNAAFISRYALLTWAKLYYYKIFAGLYGFMGRRNDVVMVNSSWTRDHIKRLWSSRCAVVYPPCDTSAFRCLPLERHDPIWKIASVGQFRPEKDHSLQLKVLATLLSKLPQEERRNVRLTLIGSCRHEEDQKRVQELKLEASNLGVAEQVEFSLNISYGELQKELGRSVAALHTMWNEHFGISVVECMAAGCVMVAHDSGGPAMDIVVDWHGKRTGYLAKEKDHFVSCLLEAFQLSADDRLQVVTAARDAVQARFSVPVFEESFLKVTEPLFVQ